MNPNQALVKQNQTDYEAMAEKAIKGLKSPHTRLAYKREIQDYIRWATDRRDEFSYASVQAYKEYLMTECRRGDTAINLALSAIRKFARELAREGRISRELSKSIRDVEGIRYENTSQGNWLSKKECEKLLHCMDCSTPLGLRDRVILAVAIGCGLRRSEICSLSVKHLQQREGRWVIVGLRGKGNKKRDIPVPSWAKAIIDQWCEKMGIESGVIVRAVRRMKHVWKLYDKPITTEAIYYTCDRYSHVIGRKFAPHDLRRTYAKLARKNGADLEQIQITLGHKSLKTTQTYLGTELNLQNAPGDLLNLDIEV